MTDNMRVNSYKPNEYFQPQNQDALKSNINPLAQVPESIPMGQIPDSFPTNDVKSVEAAKPSRFSAIKATFNKILSLFAPDLTKDESQVEEAKIIDQSIQVIGSRPVLQKPESGPRGSVDGLFSALKKAEAEHLITRVNNKDVGENVEIDAPKERISLSDINDSALERATFDVHKEQVKIREKASVNDSQAIIEHGNEKKRLWTQYLDLKAEAQRKGEQSKILGWLSFGSGLIGGALFLGGLVATILTGGAALPGAIAVAGGIAALSGGGNQIGSSILGYQSNVRTGESLSVKEEVNFKKDAIMAKLQNMEDNDNSITQLWSNIGQMLKNMPDFFR